MLIGKYFTSNTIANQISVDTNFAIWANVLSRTAPLYKENTRFNFWAHGEIYQGTNNLLISYHTDSHLNNPSSRRCHHKFCATEIVHVESRSKCNSVRQIRHDSHSFDCIALTPTRIHRSNIGTDHRNLDFIFKN